MTTHPIPVVSIDVSKATLAVCYQHEDQLRHLDVSNDAQGFAQLLATCGTEGLFVMEATGTYYLALAYHLHTHGVQVVSQCHRSQALHSDASG